VTTLIHERVQMCRHGTNPKTICRVNSGWVVIGDVQFLSGYCLLLPDPVVADLNTLDVEARALYLREASIVGDALLASTDAYRINYEILGNTEAALHTHIFPRYLSEPQERRKQPVWFYDWNNAPKFDPDRDGPLMHKVRRFLDNAGITQ